MRLVRPLPYLPDVLILSSLELRHHFEAQTQVSCTSAHYPDEAVFQDGMKFALSHPGCLRSLKDSSVLTQEGLSGNISAGSKSGLLSSYDHYIGTVIQHVDDSDGEVQVCNGCEHENVFGHPGL